jgi:hypothetical protein
MRFTVKRRFYEIDAYLFKAFAAARIFACVDAEFW